MMYFIGFQNTIVTTADDSTAAIVSLAIDRRSPDIPMATQQPVVKQAVALLSEGNVGVRLRLPLTIDQGVEERRGDQVAGPRGQLHLPTGLLCSQSQGTLQGGHLMDR